MDSDHHKDLGHGQPSSSWIEVIITIIFYISHSFELFVVTSESKGLSNLLKLMHI